MSLSTKNILSLLIIYLSFALIQSEIEPDSIPMEHKETITLSEENSFNKYYVINYSEADLENENYLLISTQSTSYSKPGFIYVSFSEKNPSADKRDYLSQNLGKNEIIISTSKLKNKTKIYINIHSLEKTEITFGVTTPLYIYMGLPSLAPDPYNSKKKFKISDVEDVRLAFVKGDDNYNKIMLYSIGESVDYFKMSIAYRGETVDLIKTYTPLQKFDNGFGAIIDLNEVETGTFSVVIEATSEKYKDKEVEVGVEFAEESNSTIRDIEIMEHVYGYISNSENCYKIKNLDDTANKTLTLLLNVYSQAMSFVIYNDLKEKQYSLDVFNNYYIKLPAEKFDNNYFCFKKFTRKDKDTEELGEISYDMQIYYDDELTPMQSYFYPLVNGKIYTYSITPGQIMFFRHFDHTENNLVYSTVMNELRGKPVLYGYNCDSFPECNLDMDKFNEMKTKGKIDSIKKINRYYINNKGVKEINIGKSFNDRNQYLSVVVCESEEDLPNKGECQFSIEINEFSDEIQLVPEMVYANTILFAKNYFRIKLSDYQNLNKVKISFTVLTGSAEIEFYSDKNHENIFNNYAYSHGHRKEYFEITENILENYYLIVTALDTSFIELKYETDFHYKGYIMTNPNEMNIALVNKAQYYDTFEILNPYYFYPENHPKNNNFSFTVASLDCGLIFRYNFEDTYNVTSYLKEFYTTKKYFFTTSYAFMLKADVYYHTVKDDNENCAVMIYEGEKSADTPLLILEDMFHPSVFKDTYYIYPFIIDNDLNGILVQFKFDYDNIVSLNLTSKPNVEVVFKLQNQNDNFETHTITKDSSFFIPKKNIEQYCPEIFYQCSLKIEINKQENYEENKFYTIYTNVHSSQNSLEYVTKNKLFNYKLKPYDKKYFYTQVDAGEQGEINFIFNKGNGIIYASLVEKSDEKKNKIPDFQTSLLYYDHLNNIIKYDAKDKNNCARGCELYFMVENKENSDNYLSEVSFSINKKWKDNNAENGIIEMTLNKYIKGTFKKDEYKYYTITIPYDYQKISINLYSNKGKAYIKEGKFNFCKKEDHSWELSSNGGFERIVIDANEHLKVNSLKGVSFSIGITHDESYEIKDDDNLFYYLEIQGLYNDENPFYHITSERSIICNTNNNLYCNGILYIDSNHNNNKSLISAVPNLGKATIYAKVIAASEFEQITYDQSIQDMFPTNEKYEQKSEENNYIFINTENTKDVYILLTIYSDQKNDKIQLLSNGFDSKKILIPYGTEKLVDVNQNIEVTFPYDYEASDNSDYIINIKSIKGRHDALIKGDRILYNIDGNYYVRVKYNETFYIFKDELNSENEAIIISCEPKKTENNFKLEKNIKNEIILLTQKNLQEFFPQNTYIEITSPLKVEIYFHDIVYRSLDSEDKFKIKAKIKNSKGVIVEEEIYTEYLLKEKTAIVKITEEEIKTDDRYYLYITVDKDYSENINIYKEMQVQYIANEAKDMEIIPNKFYFSFINNNNKKDIYIINKKQESDKYIVIDFSEKTPILDNFVIETDLISNNIKEIDFHGRKRFIAELGTNNGINFSISRKTYDDNKKYYLLNYYSVDDLSNIEDYNGFNDTLFISQNKDNKYKSNLIFNNMMIYKKLTNAKNLVYYIDVFEKNEEIKESKNIYSIYLGNHDDDYIKESIFVNNVTDDYSKELFSEVIDIPKEQLKENYVIRVLADMINENDQRERFVYNAELVDIDEPEDTTDQPHEDTTDQPHEDTTDQHHEDTTDGTKTSTLNDGSTAVIICSLFIVIVLLVVTAVTFLCIKLKKRNALQIDALRTERQTENNDSLLP